MGAARGRGSTFARPRPGVGTRPDRTGRARRDHVSAHPEAGGEPRAHRGCAARQTHRPAHLHGCSAEALLTDAKAPLPDAAAKVPSAAGVRAGVPNLRESRFLRPASDDVDASGADDHFGRLRHPGLRRQQHVGGPASGGAMGGSHNTECEREQSRRSPRRRNAVETSRLRCERRLWSAPDGHRCYPRGLTGTTGLPIRLLRTRLPVWAFLATSILGENKDLLKLFLQPAPPITRRSRGFRDTRP
jgi:hypothetical protein